MKVAADRCMKSGKKDQAKVGYIAASAAQWQRSSWLR